MEPVVLSIQIEQETDGRWIAEVPELPGVLRYGASPEEAASNAKALALRLIADRVEHSELPADLSSLSFVAA